MRRAHIVTINGNILLTDLMQLNLDFVFGGDTPASWSGFSRDSSARSRAAQNLGFFVCLSEFAIFPKGSTI